MPRLIVFCAALFLTSAAVAQNTKQLDVVPLNDSEKQAIESITEGNTLATISFLASDEMAGRKVAAMMGATTKRDHKQFGAMLYRRSDNWPLASAGVVAHSFSAGSLHKDYHQPTDEWEKLKIPHMTREIRGLMAGTLPIANGELTPSRTKK